MNRSSRKRALRRVGLSSAIVVTVLASAVGVASASPRVSRFADSPAARSLLDAGTNAPPMPPGGPRGIGGDVKALTRSSITTVYLDATAGSYVNTTALDAATVENGGPGPGNGPGPNNGSGPVGAGLFARGPPAIPGESHPMARGSRNKLKIA